MHTATVLGVLKSAWILVAIGGLMKYFCRRFRAGRTPFAARLMAASLALLLGIPALLLFDPYLPKASGGADLVGVLLGGVISGLLFGDPIKWTD